ncbi:MAG: ATPase, T2SS/T4P/T4SS family [Candidatus Hydrogenedens sp.]
MSQNIEGNLSSPMGQALVDEGVITEEQLRRALRIQSLLEQPRHLSDVLIELGYATRQTINQAITKHGGNLRLGDLLIEQGIITPEVLNSALALQKERGIRLGEALIELGAINERTLLRNLAHQMSVPFIEPEFPMIDPRLLQGVSPAYLRKYNFIPFSKEEDGSITVVVSDINNDQVRQAIQDVFQGQFNVALGPQDAIQESIQAFEEYRRQITQAPGTAHAGEDNIIQLVDHLLITAIERRASDIHIEPMADKIRIRYRIDGVLVYHTDLPLTMLPRLISRIKIMAGCNITEHQRHQGGRILFPYKGKDIDLRLSIYVTVYGESAVMRVLNRDLALVTLDELGMNRSMLERYRYDVLDLPTGVVLITGPTGSGKTTTLYASIAYSNDVSRKIITAEDPVEFTIDGVVQCSVNDKVNRTFDSTLREIVRQDPDIIVIGEIRDRETAQVAIQAALTGHKVYSTFHTEDTIGGLLRLIDMDIETFLISSTVISVLAQRLLRRICPKCIVPYIPTAREAQSLGLDYAEVREYEYKRGKGCQYCSYTGYRGRVGAYELLVLNEDVKEAILQKKTAHEIRRISVDSTGLISMREDAISKVIRGTTTYEEVVKHTPRTFNLRSIRQIMTLCS